MTLLDPWIARLIGPRGSHALPAPLDLDALRTFQLKALNRTLAYARDKSPFYREHLSHLPGIPLAGLGDLARVPFTTATDLRSDPMRFLCVSQSRVPHVVTLSTSGTTGQPKRLFFSEDDLERTVDFFHHGMATLVSPGQRVLTLMPGGRPGSVGALLTRALTRLGVTNFVHGFVADPEAASRDIADKSIDCLVGLPAQVLALARHMEAEGEHTGCRVSSVLLSGDHAPETLLEEIARILDCRVYTHYGLTETGFGGGIECGVRDGYHLREADLLVEVVDPETGAALPDGVPGEVVVTTLTRAAMPLLRYRTGDEARFLPGPCPCGTALCRLGRIGGRIGEPVRLPEGGALSVRDLNRTLLPIPGLLHCRTHLETGEHTSTLRLKLYVTRGTVPEMVSSRALDAVSATLAMGPEAGTGTPRLETLVLEAWPWASEGPVKSRIIVNADN